MLRRREDVRSVAWAALLFLLTWACWTREFYAGVPLLMYFTFACACISHNSMHCRVFYSQTLEEVWRVVLSLAYGHAVQTYISGHNKTHHSYLQKEGDLMRTDQMKYKWPILNLLLFMPTVAPKVARNDLNYMLDSWHAARASGRYCSHTISTCVQMACVLGVQAWLLWIDARKAVLLWWLPRIWAQYAIVTINMLQHDGCEPVDKKNMNHSRNFTDPILNWLLFNNGYHCIHHLMPNAHWSQLPEMHRRLVVPYIDPTLNEPSMIGYIYRTYVWPSKLKPA